jgi:cephalosporin-C deacetylase-like acetyl esterase
MLPLLPLLILAVTRPQGPVAFGMAEIARAAGPRARRVHVQVVHKGPSESYAIRGSHGEVFITGADANGAMYGALEFAERVKMRGEAAWREAVTGKPYLRDRGMNLFLTLPWNYEENDTDYDPAALTDPRRWYFHDDGYWTSLFDLMARARLNWLDIHGTWDISRTDAPNLYAYFIQSDRYPEVGVAPAIKAANLRQLNRIIAMAHDRGIRVSLMAYQATLNIPQNPRPPYRATEAVLYDYTREVVEKMIRQAPGLDAIGFRIGESGRGESFYHCYLEAVKRSGRKIPLITRSWLTRKRNVLPLARAFADFTVEIKYNGEQWGPDYPVVGGRMANWYSYSFEDYLSDSGSAPAAKMWPGNPTADGSRWPEEPYKIVWQVRANGTHRIFPFYEPDRVRNTIRQMKIGAASGYTAEGLNAYYPASPRYYLANPSDQYCNWIHERDEMYWLLWGRLGYDPNTPESVFERRIGEWFGGQGRQVARLWKTASRIVPLAFTAFSLGPDHRNHAPELEWGGTTDDYITAEPFDPLCFRGIREELADRATGAVDGRPGLAEVSDVLSGYANAVQAGVARVDTGRVPEAGRKRLKELMVALKQVARLGAYYRWRFLAAWDVAAAESEVWKIRGEVRMNFGWRAAYTWQMLANSPEARFYKPFTERLRMHTNTYHWRDSMPRVEAEAATLERLPEVSRPAVHSVPLLNPPSTARLTWRAQGSRVECFLPASGLDRAWLLVKPLPSSTFFHKTLMRREGNRFVARFTRENWGHCIAAEVERNGTAARIPSPLNGETPYLVIPARKGLTPQIYSAEEAMTYLDPAVLTPGKYGILLLGTRAWAFHRSFPVSVRRKLLDPVRRGMTLLVLQQDYASGRYPLDWLPGTLRAVAKPAGVFDPGGALGLPTIRTRDILWQTFVPGSGWEVFGSGGVAHRKFGKGDIWMVQARIQPRLHIRECAQTLVRLLRLGGTRKPVVLIDSGTEGADKSSAIIPDMLNAQGIPFLTLGEVIAREQKMDSFRPVAGKIEDDDILEGRGPGLMKAFLAAKVKARAAIPTAPTRAAFEALRSARRAELMRALGLAPMPPRTPLHARITGTYRRSGYRVENIVLESRPRFYVTAQAYVPDGPAGARYPVILNPIGHWARKKAEPVVQSRCIFQALRGYLAVVVDSPGWSFEGDNKIERRGEGTHNDYKLVQGGTNATGYYVWDLMRVLDYVATRPDADMSRVGLTGASGGGLATLYAFAADDRYTCAVPVVYVASVEIAPDNGCLCNHVPGVLQVGDRADVLGIQAPKPLLIIGAQEDGEFPPDAMRLTGEKAKRTWALFGAGDAVRTLIFPGGHDYGRTMREAAMGFFDRYLKGVGDGSPVPEPDFRTEDPAGPEMFVLDKAPDGERTMRDLSMERLQNPAPVSFAEVVRVNGGLPARSPLHYREIGTGAKRHVTFESEPGLPIPGILFVPQDRAKGVKIFVSEEGKAAAVTQFHVTEEAGKGYVCLCLDARGFGELSGINQRYLTYLGTALPFMQGWDIARAAEAMRRYSDQIEFIGKGPIASLAVLYAGLMEPKPARVVGYDCLREFADVFREGVPDLAVQPRANLCGPLSHLRSLVPQGEWRFMGE